MGLDMYLEKRHHIYGDDRRKKTKINIKGIDPKKIKVITEEVFYWRKANQIHQWFVDNVQEGVDECQESYVDKEDFEKLLKTIKEVLADRKKKTRLLSTQKGFFFGGTDYDKYYWQDLKETEKILAEILKKDDFEMFSYYYRSSR